MEKVIQGLLPISISNSLSKKRKKSISNSHLFFTTTTRANSSYPSSVLLFGERKMEAIEDDQSLKMEPPCSPSGTNPPEPPLSKNARKRLLKQQRYEVKKAEKKAQAKDAKKKDIERKRKEWDDRLASVTEEERSKLIESRRNLRKERMGKRSEEREMKIERLNKAKDCGQNIVIDLEFSHLMTPSEIHSLVQQIMYCYAVNGRCPSPGHLWLTGCNGEMETQLQKLPGFDKWIIEREQRSYIDALQDQKENLVYLTADAETVLDDLDLKKTYIIGGLVDRNRWKGITMKKAQEQGIQTAKLPIGSYLKMSSSQVLTVNQVIEILLKYLETRDWKDSFFQVVPQRKRCEVDSHSDHVVDGEENGDNGDDEHETKKTKCDEISSSN